jgi:hypothetical protein
VHILIDGIWNDDLVEYSDEDKAMRFAKKAMAKFMSECEDIDRATRTKITSLKRGVVEGSTEWDVLYGKYFDEEMAKRGNN